MTFETFTPTRGTRALPDASVTVTVRTNGDLALSPRVAAALGRPAFVSLAYDRDTRTVRVAAVNAHAPEAIRRPVKYPGPNAAAIVHASQFLRWAGVDRVESATRYAVRLSGPRGGIMDAEFCFADAGTTTGGRR